jgi:cytoskeletal protein RodZ
VGLVNRWYELSGTTAIEKAASSPPSSVIEEQQVQKPKGFWQRSKDDKKESETATSEKPKTDEEVELEPNTCTGTIWIGQTNVRDVDLKWWRSQIGLVQQEPFLFNDTLFNNVAFGLC